MFLNVKAHSKIAVLSSVEADKTKTSFGCIAAAQPSHVVKLEILISLIDLFVYINLIVFCLNIMSIT